MKLIMSTMLKRSSDGDLPKRTSNGATSRLLQCRVLRVPCTIPPDHYTKLARILLLASSVFITVRAASEPTTTFQFPWGNKSVSAILLEEDKFTAIRQSFIRFNDPSNEFRRSGTLKDYLTDATKWKNETGGSAGSGCSIQFSICGRFIRKNLDKQDKKTFLSKEFSMHYCKHMVGGKEFPGSAYFLCLFAGTDGTHYVVMNNVLPPTDEIDLGQGQRVKVQFETFDLKSAFQNRFFGKRDGHELKDLDFICVIDGNPVTIQLDSNGRVLEIFGGLYRGLLFNFDNKITDSSVMMQMTAVPPEIDLDPQALDILIQQNIIVAACNDGKRLFIKIGGIIDYLQRSNFGASKANWAQAEFRKSNSTNEGGKSHYDRVFFRNLCFFDYFFRIEGLKGCFETLLDAGSIAEHSEITKFELKEGLSKYLQFFCSKFEAPEYLGSVMEKHLRRRASKRSSTSTNQEPGKREPGFTHEEWWGNDPEPSRPRRRGGCSKTFEAFAAQFDTKVPVSAST